MNVYMKQISDYELSEFAKDALELPVCDSLNSTGYMDIFCLSSKKENLTNGCEEECVCCDVWKSDDGEHKYYSVMFAMSGMFEQIESLEHTSTLDIKELVAVIKNKLQTIHRIVRNRGMVICK